jgi:hypothetical protein
MDADGKPKGMERQLRELYWRGFERNTCPYGSTCGGWIKKAMRMHTSRLPSGK